MKNGRNQRHYSCVTWIGSTARSLTEMRNQQRLRSKTLSKGPSPAEPAVARAERRRTLTAELVEIDPGNANPTYSDDGMC